MGTWLIVLALLGLCRADNAPPPNVVTPAALPPQPRPDDPRSAILCNALGHEVSACVFDCAPERTCQNVNSSPPTCGPSSGSCTPKCICDSGYARNQKGGPCVTLAQCAKCGENEVFECLGDYSADCAGYCNCLSGYTRDINDKCIYVDPAAPPRDFGPPIPEPEPCTGLCALQCNNVTDHEIAGCIYSCPPERTCQNRNWPPPPCAPPGFPCTPKCVCDGGFLRATDGGPCITEAQCDKCGENEYFQCDGDYSKNCVGQCYCLSGYTRDINDKCVYVDPATPPKDNAPPTPEPDAKCGENEVFECLGDYSADCAGYCNCLSGYTRDINDKCIYVDPAAPPRDFGPPIPEPEPCTGLCGQDLSTLQCNNVTDHEIPGCTYGCPPERTCQNRNWPPPPCARPTFPCTPKCICDGGFLRTMAGGPCVTEAQCDQCGENEYFQCDGDYSEHCVGHCYCLSGYTRDVNGHCVYVDPATPPTDNAPPTPEPDALQCNNVTDHEIAGCIYGCPPERTCQNRNWPPLPCARPIFPCTPKCVCDNGYLRTMAGGPCVTEAQCDQCGENEYFQCDGDYSEHCVGHCYCLSGYTRDINDKCVYVDPATPPKDNAPPTPEPDELKCDNATLHEVEACIYPCPPEKTCQNLHQPEPPCLPSEQCTKKCVCAAGYVRNQIGGTCVTKAQCDKCPFNQYFKCDGLYSENCAGSCQCVAGYKRDANNNCVSFAPTPRPICHTPGRRPIRPIPPLKPIQPLHPFVPGYYGNVPEFYIFYDL